MTITDINRIFPKELPENISFLPLLDQFHEGVIITDASGNILYMNKLQEEMDDLKLSDVRGKSVKTVYRVDEDESPVKKCLKTGESICNLACYYRTRMGRVLNSLHNVMPLYSGKKLIGTICFIRPYNLLARELNIFSEPGNTSAVRSTDPPALNKKGRQLNNGTRFSFTDIIGQAPEFLEAIDACRMASSSPSPVMLFGETGTGKELLAQSVHNKSLRRKQHYVALNCAAVPENLLEGILFGTTRGAFTGATDKAGLFEKASGGTLFLDEINSMSMGLQAKLLRVLQERKIRRVGALEEVPLDLKIISSVNEDPHQSIRNKTIRADLLYRLGVVFVRIPPLRERKQDILLLVLHFIDKFNRLMGKQLQGVSPRVMELFHRYTWQGNVRELEHVIEGAMNLVRNHQVIRIRHLSVHIGNLSSISTGSDHPDDRADPSQLTSLSTVSGGPDSNIPQWLGRESEPVEKKPSHSGIREDHEIFIIKKTLTQTRGNVARAARRLNLSPQLLHYKLNKYRIQAADFKPKLKLS